MEQTPSAPNPGVEAPVQSQPVTTPPAQSPVQPPQQTAPTTHSQKSNNPWPWIIGGCLTIVLVTFLIIALLGWWGFRQAKKAINEEMERYEPTIEGVQGNIERMNKEAEEWEKKSKEYRETMPDPEEFTKELENMQYNVE